MKGKILEDSKDMHYVMHARILPLRPEQLKEGDVIMWSFMLMKVKKIDYQYYGSADMKKKGPISSVIIHSLTDEDFTYDCPHYRTYYLVLDGAYRIGCPKCFMEGTIDELGKGRITCPECNGDRYKPGIQVYHGDELSPILLKTKNHWNRMMMWVIEQPPDNKPNSNEMVQAIGESWIDDWCPLCLEYNPKKDDSCEGCPMNTPHNKCVNPDSPWRKVKESKTWIEWKVNARALIATLEHITEVERCRITDR